MNLLPPLKSIRARLTALFVLIFGLTLITLGTIGYRYFSKTQQLDFDTALFNHVVDVASTVSVNFVGEISVPDFPNEALEKVFPFSLKRSYMQIRDLTGQITARSENLHDEPLPLSQENYDQLMHDSVSFQTIPNPVIAHRTLNTSYRLISYYVNRPPLPEFILQVAAPMTFIERAQKDMRSFLFIAIPLMLIISTLSGLFFSYRALSPVSAITHKAESIHVENLSERVPVPTSSDDEITELAKTFNRLLDRVETTVSSNQRFVADASHQLKTPLSILRGELDLILRKERSPEEVRGFLESASQEINALTQLVESLLILARTEAGAGSISLSPTRLDEIAMEVVSRLNSLAKGKKIKLTLNLHKEDAGVESDFQILGDADLIRTMLQNLVENAVKYSPEGAVVEISIADLPKTVDLKIRDHGPGIPKENLEKLFDRFYRDPSTEQKAKGFGLGLAIARSIAKVHHADIQVSTIAGEGTTFIIQMRKI